MLSGGSGVAAATCHGPATADTATGVPSTDGLSYPPSNVTTDVTLFPASDKAEVYVRYPARTEAEADLFEHGTVGLDWMRADERLSSAVRARNESLAEQCDRQTGVSDPVASSSEYGDIGARLTFEWEAASPTNQSALVLGPTVNDHLANGTVVEVSVPSDTWVAERSTVQTFTTGNHGQYRVYRWTVGETETEPRVVFNESVGRSETDTAEDGALGPTGGMALALFAVVLTAVGRSRRG